MKYLIAAWLWLTAAYLALGLLPYSPAPAFAEISGNCSATFKGVDVAGLNSNSAGSAIKVKEGELVEVQFNSPAGFQSHKIKLQATAISGSAVTVSTDNNDGGDTSFTETVNVDDYAWAGAGLYRVSGTATLSDGRPCSGAALVNVDKNPLTTVAGVAAAGATAAGAVGVVGATVVAATEAVAAPRKVEDWVINEIDKASARPTSSYYDEPAGPPYVTGVWLFDMCLWLTLPALLLTGLMMVGLLPTSALAGGSGAGGDAGRRLRRATWRPRISVVGLVGSVLFGLGFTIFLQQSGEVFPDEGTFLQYIGAGLIVGIVVPSLIRVVTVMRANRAIASAESRLAAARGSAPAATTAPPAETPPPSYEPVPTEPQAPEGGVGAPEQPPEETDG